ncbi:hypothetical protein N7468_000401 [Penicillium chermesinum]|uniref:Uncharacterized protein n=1 Tax=Penicillium chermesinum TaxID=63820 RepID=A0A9W9PM67_9EURO|nr:uncharacterized protein N7468_000401 [Penicillium chermesinum]KAJ5248950.1 hypothetical protein N7468_000401 [Penicillium chermesinum]
MDGDQRMRHHERLMARSGNGSAGGRATESFESAMHQMGDPAGMSQAPDRAPMAYDYGYTGAPFHGGSLQSNEVQDYPDFVRRTPSHLEHQPAHPQTLLRRRSQQRHEPFVPYDSGMLYSFSHPSPAQGPFDVVPQYSSRPSAANDGLSNPFSVSQYFTPEDSAATGVGTLTSRLEPTQPEPPHHAPEHAPLEEAYAQYQQALRSTFDHTRAGRLVEASRSLLEISEWLVTNARDLGLLRDDHLSYPDRLELWKDFNICWLAVGQKQKDLTQDYITTGRPPAQASLLSRDRMEAMGRDLIQLCDQLEQHGLVDYQMGIWEEEILSILGQCLDLVESKPELHMQADRLIRLTSNPTRLIQTSTSVVGRSE